MKLTNYSMTRTCPHCHTNYRVPYSYCMYCGTRLVKVAPAENAAATRTERGSSHAKHG